MTQRPIPFMFPGEESEEPPNPPPGLSGLPESPPTTLALGHLTICLDHPDFLPGYQEGVRQYDQWHSKQRTTDTATLLFLIRNGWGDRQHSVFWQTGYIVGWLRSLFAHAYHVEEALE